MQKTMIQEPVSPLHHPVPATLQMERLLNVIVVYEDAGASRWAKETCDQMFGGTSKQSVRTTWWKLSELSQPAVLAGAVSKAMRADVIVVAIRTTEGFPLPFYVWVSSWLPHRLRGAGTLVGLIAAPESRSAHMNRAVQYLRAVARRARMRCLIKERDPIGEAGCGPVEAPHGRGPAAVPPLRGTPTPLRRDGWRHWFPAG
jgi:hypothetical protein